jgi:uncharacterized protein YndB with AHSA1/START domain
LRWSMSGACSTFRTFLLTDLVAFCRTLTHTKHALPLCWPNSRAAMRSVIQQSVVLPAPADRLFAMYMDPAAHQAITGYPVAIGADPGAEFRAFDGQLSGRMLAVVPPRLVVQSWRSTKFKADDKDSTLILCFVPEGSEPNCGRIDLIHVDVPDHDFQGVTEGWAKHYWTPWRSFLERE